MPALKGIKDITWFIEMFLIQFVVLYIIKESLFIVVAVIIGVIWIFFFIPPFPARVRTYWKELGLGAYALSVFIISNLYGYWSF